MYHTPVKILQNNKYCRFHTDDVDVARAKVAEVYCDHKLSLSKGKLDAFHYHVPFDGVSVNYMRYGPQSTIEPGCLGDFYLIQMPVSGDATIEADGVKTESYPGKASILNPNAYIKMDWSDGCEQILVQISKEKLEAVLNRSIGVRSTKSITFDAFMENNNQTHTAWWRHLIRFLNEHNSEEGFYQCDKMVASEIHNIVRGFLYSVNNNHSELLRSDKVQVYPRHVKQATEYIRTHYKNPVTIKDLVKITGVSERSLFEGFKNNLQLTPMQFLTQTRLVQVRHQLKSQSRASGLSVTRVALENGFNQLGRFAACYKAVFGESPSETFKQNN